MAKNDGKKRKFKVPHGLVFALSLLGVAALMALYIWFVGTVLAGSETMNDDTPAYVQPDFAEG
ncbi:MAG: hypothetical protein J6N15_13085 [Ruminiclostridium sp.]|nr:hypothetical protein [Ruminiclostridium sp.]